MPGRTQLTPGQVLPSFAAGAGLFIVGTDTSVGKTYVAARIAAALFASNVRVGVYKPAASGCRLVEGQVVSDDAAALWEAAGRPGDLEAVCPQRFLAALAPHLAARAEGKQIDPRMLREGIECWRVRSDVVIVEGAGGLMSPIAESRCVADLAGEFGYPLVLVTPNRIGAINGTLLTLMAAANHQPPLKVAGIVLNDLLPGEANDPAVFSNRAELERLASAPVIAQLAHSAGSFDPPVDWLGLARGRTEIDETFLRRD